MTVEPTEREGGGQVSGLRSGAIPSIQVGKTREAIEAERPDRSDR
jgi:hypothetical protein